MMHSVLLRDVVLRILMKFNKTSFFRFVLSGGANTVLTYLLYLLLILFLDYKVSFTISYVAGMIFSYFANRFFVFNSGRGVNSAILFPVVYLIQYGCGLFIVWCWVGFFSLPEIFAPIVSVALLVPLTYIMMRFVFKDLKK